MKWKRIKVFLTILGVISICLFVSYKGLIKSKNIYSHIIKNQNLIKVAVPKRMTFIKSCHWFGKVRSRNQTKIIALEQGRIISIKASDGEQVKKGELLFTIGGKLIDMRIDTLLNQLTILQKRVNIAENIVKEKQKAFTQHFVKYDELTSAEDKLLSLKTAMDSTNQKLQMIQETTHLRATIGGVLINRKVSVGQEVRKGDILGEIIAINHLYIVATLFPHDKETKLKDKQAVIYLHGRNSLRGIVTSVFPQKTAEGATIVRIEGVKLGHILRPGQPVSGIIILSAHKNALAVPQEAVIKNKEEKSYIFIKNSSGYHKKIVKTGVVSNGWIEIISGLKAKDKVVIKGAYELFYHNFNKIFKVED